MSGSVTQRVKDRGYDMFKKFLSSSVGMVIATALALGLAGCGLLGVNAFAVYLDGTHFGYIEMDSELPFEDFHNMAVLSLQAAHGNVNVRVDQHATIVPTRTTAENLETYNEIIMRLIREGFTFEISAFEIWVHGGLEARIRTESDLLHLESMLQEIWWNENTVASEFAEGWKVRRVYVCPYETEFDSPETAYFRLERTTMRKYVQFPLISVRTIDEIQHETYTIRIFRINGVEQFREIFDTEN